MERSKRDDFAVILLGVVLSWLMYLVVMNELPKTLADYNGHTYVYLPMFKKGTWLEGGSF